MSKKQKAYVALLLDRSGSMNTNKVETISAVNSYTDKLKKNFKGRFTLTQFDSEGIDMPQENVKIKNIVHLTEETYKPRSMTPLLDAIGKTMNAAKTEGFENVIFVIVTDGQENASREYKLEAIRALITEKQHKGWQVSYLGAGVDAFAEATKIGVAGGQAMNFAGAHASATMDSYAASNVRYAARSDKGSVGSADFTDEERKKAMGESA
jgi:Mg-chelatase subunit ChlD